MLSVALTASVGAQSLVHVDAAIPSVPRPLEQQTQQAVIRDYLESWKSMETAFQQNSPDLLKADFVGGAKDILAGAIEEQSSLGMRMRYQDISHNLRIVFYSPEGLSIELEDVVRYNMQVFDHGRLITSCRVNTRYLVVMTPSQVRWRVRVFQAAQV
jgi:hypothetical protein